MRAAIQDEFTKRPLSKQRKWQLRQRKRGRCSVCGEPAPEGLSCCLPHLVAQREAQRRRRKAKRRYHSLSYRIEWEAAQTAKYAKYAKEEKEMKPKP